MQLTRPIGVPSVDDNNPSIKPQLNMKPTALLPTLSLALATAVLGTLSLGVASVRAEDSTNCPTDSCTSGKDGGCTKKKDKTDRKAKKGADAAGTSTNAPMQN